MLSSTYAQIGLALHVLALGCALIRGDRIVRTGALILLFSATAAVIFQDQTYRGHDSNLLAIEVVQFVALATLAGFSRRSFAAVMASLSLLAIMLHIAKSLSDSVATFPYLTLIILNGYTSLLVLLIASFQRRSGARM